LDRANDFESLGRGFESLRAHHLGIAGLNANAHDIAVLNALEVEMLQRCIADFGIAERFSGRSGQDTTAIVVLTP
jgi:hypothetical protein